MKIGFGHIKLVRFNNLQNMTLRVKAPMFITQQLPWYKISQRRLEDFYIPTSLTDEQQASLTDMYQEAYATYQDLVNQDVLPQEAWHVLPMSIFQETKFSLSIQDLDGLEPEGLDDYYYGFKQLSTLLKTDDEKVTLVGVGSDSLILHVKAPMFIFHELPKWSIIYRRADADCVGIPFVTNEDTIRKLASIFRTMLANDAPWEIARHSLPECLFEDQLVRTTISELADWCDSKDDSKDCQPYARNFRKILNFVT